MNRLSYLSPLVRVLLASSIFALSASCFAQSTAPVPKPSESISNKKNETRQQNYEAKSDGKSAEPPSPSVEISPPFVIDIKAKEKAAHHSDSLSPEWAIFWATLGLVGVTGALAVYTAKLFRATVKLGEDAKSAGFANETKMSESIAEAGRAATAMEDSVAQAKLHSDTARDVMHAQMRAYLHVSSGRAIKQNGAIGFRGLVEMNNFGHTPARNICEAVACEVFSFPLPDDHPFPDVPYAMSKDVSVAPHQTYTFDSYRPLTVKPMEDVTAAIVGSQKRLYVWGRISYDDVFDQRHVTNFCYSVVFEQNVELRSSSCLFHPKGNNAT